MSIKFWSSPKFLKPVQTGLVTDSFSNVSNFQFLSNSYQFSLSMRNAWKVLKQSFCQKFFLPFQFSGPKKEICKVFFFFFLFGNLQISLNGNKIQVSEGNVAVNSVRCWLITLILCSGFFYPSLNPPHYITWYCSSSSSSSSVIPFM